MIQVQYKIEGTLAACVTCGKQPHHYEIRGKSLHFLECSPCRLRTPACGSLQEAVEAWEKQNTHSLRDAS